MGLGGQSILNEQYYEAPELGVNGGTGTEGCIRFHSDLLW